MTTPSALTWLAGDKTLAELVEEEAGLLPAVWNFGIGPLHLLHELRDELLVPVYEQGIFPPPALAWDLLMAARSDLGVQFNDRWVEGWKGLLVRMLQAMGIQCIEYRSMLLALRDGLASLGRRIEEMSPDERNRVPLPSPWMGPPIGDLPLGRPRAGLVGRRRIRPPRVTALQDRLEQCLRDIAAPAPDLVEIEKTLQDELSLPARLIDRRCLALARDWLLLPLDDDLGARALVGLVPDTKEAQAEVDGPWATPSDLSRGPLFPRPQDVASVELVMLRHPSTRRLFWHRALSGDLLRLARTSWDVRRRKVRSLLSLELILARGWKAREDLERGRLVVLALLAAASRHCRQAGQDLDVRLSYSVLERRCEFHLSWEDNPWNPESASTHPHDLVRLALAFPFPFVDPVPLLENHFHRPGFRRMRRRTVPCRIDCREGHRLLRRHDLQILQHGREHLGRQQPQKMLLRDWREEELQPRPTDPGLQKWARLLLWER